MKKIKRSGYGLDLKDLLAELDGIVMPYRIYTTLEENEIKSKIKEIKYYIAKWKNYHLDKNIILGIKMTSSLFYGHFDL